MDQHEKDWLDLGRQLKDYSPEGSPEEDFQAFQELQKQRSDQKKGGPVFWISENLPLLVLLPLLGLIAFSVGKGEWDRYQRKAAAQQMIVVEGKATDIRLPTKVYGEVQTAAHDETEAIRTQVGTIVTPAELKPRPPLAAKAADGISHQTELTPEKEVAVATADEKLSLPANPEAIAPLVAVLPIQPLNRTDLVVETLPFEILLVSGPVAVSSVPAPVVSKHPTNLQITLGTGLSNHWRGANFMQEVDRGIYAYVGLNRRLGQRLGLEGRIGYRSHGMRLPVFSDVDAPWSYHKEEIHNTGHMGEDRAYIYEGVVQGYQAMEFSLLAHYQLFPRLSMSGGVRYSLPDLAFERTVVGPDEENPFFEFIEGRSLVKYQDYGALLGAEYLLSRHLAIEVGLHLGMVDLIDDAAAGRTRFNHSSSLSFGVKYKLE
ncbi:porin family protein [Neolewinella persica]|uniref:PorT family protein n=1 Tax=Neolewinella persica TaxID=70998 RepID=UPI0003602A73|nr:PorT family protein [Neolewinella persica]